MVLDFETRDNKLVVYLSGELDHHSAEDVRNKIDDRIDHDKVNKLIMDFSRVSFMDSSGIGVVIGRYKKLVNKNGAVGITKPRNVVMRIFELSGMFKIIKLYDNIEEALKCM